MPNRRGLTPRLHVLPSTRDNNSSTNQSQCRAISRFQFGIESYLKPPTHTEEACRRFNEAGQVSRRRRVELWRDIIGDTRPLPPVHPDPEADEKLFEETDPFVDPPISVDHGLNLKVGKGTFLNFNLLVLDTCLVTIGERTLFGPNVCMYGATHPLDPAVRQGLKGPEAGKEVHIEDDVWVGGSVIILAGVTIGRGSTVGAGSVVTKDVPPFHFVAGNPARIIRKIETSMDPSQSKESEPAARA